jgi:hypothetical protein
MSPSGPLEVLGVRLVRRLAHAGSSCVALRAKTKQPGTAKQPYARSAPSAPPPLAPPAQAPVEKGGQAVSGVVVLFANISVD